MEKTGFPTVQMDHRSRLLCLLKEKAFQRKRVTLASGRESDFYIDCRNVSLLAEGLFLIGKQIFEIIENLDTPVEGVGGPTLGADPIVSAVSYTSYLEASPIPAFIIRKEPKSHGSGQWLEGAGAIAKGAPVAIVEDVVTTGMSAIKAAKRAEEAGFKVAVIIALVDRDEGGREEIERAGYKLISLFTRHDFME
ncbi:MAG: orotate phosphoribosyltransferase [Myxococcota bacterium]